jgi:hypothetical protein
MITCQTLTLLGLLGSFQIVFRCVVPRKSQRNPENNRHISPDFDSQESYVTIAIRESLGPRLGYLGINVDKPERKNHGHAETRSLMSKDKTDNNGCHENEGVDEHKGKVFHGHGSAFRCRREVFVGNRQMEGSAVFKERPIDNDCKQEVGNCYSFRDGVGGGHDAFVDAKEAV